MSGNESALNAPNRNALCNPGGKVAGRAEGDSTDFMREALDVRSFVLTGELEFGFDSAGAGKTPTANRFENHEQPDRHQRQTNPKLEICHDNSADQQNRSDDAAHHPALESDISSEKAIHNPEVLVT